MLDLDHIVSFSAQAASDEQGLRWKAIARLIVIGTIFGLITKYHLIKIWKRYNAKMGMAIHTATGLVEVMKFCFEDVIRDPQPRVLDFGIAIIHSSSSWALTASTLKGNQFWTRSLFQASIVVRTGLSIFAFITGSTGAHRCACYLNHAAIYIRLIIAIFKPVVRSYSDLYTAAIFTAGMLCFESGNAETGLLPTGALTLILVLCAPILKYLSDLNVDLGLDASSSVRPDVTRDDKSVSPATANTVHLMTPGTAPSGLTTASLEHLNDVLEPLVDKRAPGIRRRVSESAYSDSQSSDSSLSIDDTPLSTPSDEGLPIDIASPVDLSHVHTSRSLGGMVTSGRPAMVRSSSWSDVIKTSASVLAVPYTDTTAFRRELRIIAARAGLSPIKEWQSVRKWDRAREASLQVQVQ